MLVLKKIVFNRKEWSKETRDLSLLVTNQSHLFVFFCSNVTTILCCVADRTNNVRRCCWLGKLCDRTYLLVVVLRYFSDGRHDVVVVASAHYLSWKHDHHHGAAYDTVSWTYSPRRYVQKKRSQCWRFLLFGTLLIYCWYWVRCVTYTNRGGARWVYGVLLLL